MDLRKMGRLAPSVLALAVSCHLASFAGNNQGEEIAAPYHFSGAKSPDELADRIEKLLSHSTRGDLGRILSVRDSTAAIAAGWQRVRLTMPETKQDEWVVPDSLAISRFLGLIEGRFSVSVPKVWEETVRSITGYSRETVWFPARLDLLLLKRDIAEWRVEADRGNWLVTKGNYQIVLPAEDRAGPVENAVVELAESKTYVAMYGSSTIGYKLFAVDPTSRKVIWTSEVWGPSMVRPRGALILIREGGDWHFVTIRSSGDLVAVFGISGGAVYLEAFDSKTGENRCRFSTAYFKLVGQN
jgi:hypothetical protein